MLHIRPLNFILFYLLADTAYSVHSPVVYRIAREALDKATSVEHAQKNVIQKKSPETVSINNCKELPLGNSRIAAEAHLPILIAQAISSKGADALFSITCPENWAALEFDLTTRDAADRIWYFGTDHKGKRMRIGMRDNSLWADDLEMDRVLASLLGSSGVIADNKLNCPTSAAVWQRLMTLAGSGYFVDMFHTGVYLPNHRIAYPVHIRLVPSHWKPFSLAQFFPRIKSVSK